MTGQSPMLTASFIDAAVADIQRPSATFRPPGAPAVYRAPFSTLAVGGYDPVAYFVLGRAERGSACHSLIWQGAEYRFCCEGNLLRFEANPHAYAPQFGGYCAWAVSQHYLAPGDPNYWKIVDDKLYLNANARAKELWEADQVDAIKRGHANWPAVLSDNQDSASQ